ncbi:MAG: hypothetical protein HKO87_00415 [Acidimicrobiia bacterium]|nr:hypothetical protein [Acidimicrobiia bacterium]
MSTRRRATAAMPSPTTRRLVPVVAVLMVAALLLTGSTPAQASTCSTGTLGGIEMGGLTDNLFVFADGNKDLNWQGASKGFVGDVVVNGDLAKERTSGKVPYAGTIYTNDSDLGKWQDIVDQNEGQATAVFDADAVVDCAVSSLHAALAQIGLLTATSGFEDRSSKSLDGLDMSGDGPNTYVINVTDDLKVSKPITITGDEGDVFVLRWDTDGDPSNGYQGQVKFQSGGAIIPAGGLTPSSFIHAAGDINASGGGENPPAPYPQAPRLDDGVGSLIDGAKAFSGGGFFTGYWLTTGSPKDGKTSSLSNAIFVGGWYTLSSKLSMTSGTSGVHVSAVLDDDLVG